jgi:hypothetical protein
MGDFFTISTITIRENNAVEVHKLPAQYTLTGIRAHDLTSSLHIYLSLTTWNLKTEQQLKLLDLIFLSIKQLKVSRGTSR